MPRRDNRCVLHRNKLNDFRDWVQTQGYVVRPPSAHAHEVLRIEEYTPSGNNPELVFYQKERYQHVTIPYGTEALVRQFILETKVSRKSPHRLRQADGQLPSVQKHQGRDPV